MELEKVEGCGGGVYGKWWWKMVEGDGGGCGGDLRKKEVVLVVGGSFDGGRIKIGGGNWK